MGRSRWRKSIKEIEVRLKSEAPISLVTRCFNQDAQRDHPFDDSICGDVRALEPCRGDGHVGDRLCKEQIEQPKTPG